MDTYKIRQDLQESLKNIDRNDYVLKSVIDHLEKQCTEEEVALIESEIYELSKTEYEDREDFILDYQDIFDAVDFPFDECFRMMDKKARYSSF